MTKFGRFGVFGDFLIPRLEVKVHHLGRNLHLSTPSRLVSVTPEFDFPVRYRIISGPPFPRLARLSQPSALVETLSDTCDYIVLDKLK